MSLWSGEPIPSVDCCSARMGSQRHVGRGVSRETRPLVIHADDSVAEGKLGILEVVGEARVLERA